MSKVSSQAQPASFEDCDEDSGVALPNSKVEARTQPPPNSQSQRASNVRPDRPRSVRPDSLRQSNRSSTPSTSTQTRHKPIVHEPRPKSTVQQTMPPPLSRTSSMKNQKSSNTCNDPQCRVDHRVKQSRPPPQQFEQLHVQTQNLPSARVSRPRSTSASQARPVSWAGYQAPYAPEYFPQPVVSPQEYGPPPARSAFYRNPNPYHQTHYGHGYVMNQPAVSPMMSSASPIDTTPLSARRAQLNYSTRMDPSQALPTISPPVRIPRARTPSISYSHQPTYVMKETYMIDDPVYLSESESDHEEYDELRMPPVLRPIIKTSRTAPSISPRTAYKDSGRAILSDNSVDFLTQDYQKHNLRPSAQRGYSSAESSRSRRQSLSTNASSSHTKATTVSGGSILVEGPNGRRRLYPSDRDYDNILRKINSQRKYEDARAYQDQVGGAARPELTAETIRDYSGRAPDVARSRTSGHSRQSNSKDGIQIVIDGKRVEVRPADEHNSTQIIIDPIQGVQTGYAASSHGSSSRIGRSRGSDGGRR